jgi:hypothetical protein
MILELENGKELVEVGDIGYWLSGKAFCVFFSLTLASQGAEIRAASEVTVFRKLTGKPGVLQGVKDGEKISVEKAL